MKRVAVIPARGGSRRIPGKNIREFCGKPIIAYSIEEAITSSLFEKVVVSTDDSAIAEIAKRYGAEVPFSRPQHLADDFATTSEVIKHAVLELDLKNSDVVCCIYATAPFLQADDLAKAAQALETNSELNFSFSAAEYPFPIQRAFSLDKGNVNLFQPEYLLTRSQDLEKAYHDAGQFYFGRVPGWLKEQPIFSERSHAIVLPSYRVQDIDEEDDWVRAELLYRAANE